MRNVAHFYSTVLNTNHASRLPNGQCTHVFVDKEKDMEPAKTTAEAEEACRWQGRVMSQDFTQTSLCIVLFIGTSEMNANITKE